MQRQKRQVLSVTLKRLLVPWPRRLPAAANCNDPLSDDPLRNGPLRNDPLRNGKPA